MQMRIDYSFVKRSVIKGFEKLSEGWEASAERDLCILELKCCLNQKLNELDLFQGSVPKQIFSIKHS